MIALVYDKEGPRLRRDYSPSARHGEALIAPRLVGICSTDLEITRGYMGFEGVLGHEWVGTVIEASDPSWKGKRVVGDINCPCHQCEVCHAGGERPT